MKNFYRIIILISLSGVSYNSAKAVSMRGKCKHAFTQTSRFQKLLKNIRSKGQKTHPRPATDPLAESVLQEQWNKEDFTPAVLKMFLPEGVRYIGHQLVNPESSDVVKLNAPDVVMVRADYKYKGRVLSSDVTMNFDWRMKYNADRENLINREKWLVGEEAGVAILFLHETGSPFAGSHTAKNTIKWFQLYEGVRVLALDLPWHGRGHREVFKSLEEEIEALSSFVKKYISPRVPLFVWGQGGGTVFAQKLMTMTDGPQSAEFFHPNLKGILLFSPHVDAAPGQSYQAKKEAFLAGMEKGLESIPYRLDKDILNYERFSGASPLAELFNMWGIIQLSSEMPSHGGSRYVPTLMAVGRKSHFFTGFPRSVFQGYFDKLENVETHYLDKRPLLGNKKETEEVDHWLEYYMDPETELPIPVSLALKFMNKHFFSAEPYKSLGRKISFPVPLLDVMGLFANNLAFRKFLIRHKFLTHSTHVIPGIENKMKRDIIIGITNLINDYKKELITTEGRDTSVVEHNINVFFNPDNLQKLHNIDQLVEYINNSIKSLPADLQARITDFLSRQEYISNMTNIKNGVYLPVYEGFLQEGLVVPKNRESIRNLLSQVSSNIIARDTLKEEMDNLQKQRKEIAAKYEKAFQEVQESINIIELAINNYVESANPVLFRDKIADIRDTLHQLKEMERKIFSAFEDASVQLIEAESSSLSRLNDILEPYKSEVQDYERLYAQYDLQRKNLRRELIHSADNLEIGGLAHQTAVNNIYGPVIRESDKVESGLSPKGHLYLQLDKLNRELARLESDIYKKNRLFEKLLLEYQNLFEELFQLLEPTALEEGWVSPSKKIIDTHGISQKAHDSEFPNIPPATKIIDVHDLSLMDWIYMASAAYYFSGLSIYNSVHSISRLRTDLESLNSRDMDPEKTFDIYRTVAGEEYNLILRDVLSVWGQFQSNQLPDLPVVIGAD